MKTDKELIFEQYLIVNEQDRQNPVVNSNGTKRYYNERGERHREDGPAIERADGSKVWYINDKLHREDGPAVEYANGDKYWYINDKRHREDGPAIERADGLKEWYINNKRHREDGPAAEWPDGSKEWFINDIFYDTIPGWTAALFEYKGWTPEFLKNKGMDYDQLTNVYAQKMMRKYED